MRKWKYFVNIFLPWILASVLQKELDKHLNSVNSSEVYSAWFFWSMIMNIFNFSAASLNSSLALFEANEKLRILSRLSVMFCFNFVSSKFNAPILWPVPLGFTSKGRSNWYLLMLFPKIKLLSKWSTLSLKNFSRPLSDFILSVTSGMPFSNYLVLPQTPVKSIWFPFLFQNARCTESFEILKN